MHSINFGLKRAYLTTNNASRKMIASNVPGMTPARFDILCFIRQKGIRRGVYRHNIATQSRISRALGLHATTISKMVTRLVQMGWVERHRDLSNHRYKVVELTKLGLRKIWQAMRVVFRMRIWLKHYEWVVRRIRPDLDVLRALDYVVDILQMLARILGDESLFEYDHGSPRKPPFFLRPLPPPIERYRHDVYPKDERSMDP